MKEYVWKIINSVIQSPLFHPYIRTYLLMILGVKLDKSARIAENVYLGSNKIIMGKHTFVNVGSFLDGNARIIIEDYVRIGPYVKILTGTHHYRHSVIRRREEDGTISKEVIIKKGSWVGMGAIILPSVTIAEGCIIAAGAVVTKDTEPNGLYAGNPARRIKDLPTTGDEM
ncbi:maltose O-acetyltransferase [Anoxybacillus tengchongensis]|uniref:Maltose O-acetyltransferase n=1 Tax=Anoxybacillus tengchongensis TaxID=576944 RepID=A0A7X0D8V3_9BACL|nr:acyltransferase [Anoxybacillus tengchongensis]MBB6176087.1 maltose O-acetyltransferase [Anoxybacillus tengchongensis]